MQLKYYSAKNEIAENTQTPGAWTTLCYMNSKSSKKYGRSISSWNLESESTTYQNLWENSLKGKVYSHECM
jgi:hypothetical protein